MTITRLAWNKAAVDLRMTFTSPKDLFNIFVFVILMLAAGFAQWNHRTIVLLGGMSLMPAVGAMLSIPSLIALEKTDGTILRRKNIPRGIPAYVAARIIYSTVTSFVSMLPLLIVVFATGADLPAGVWDVVLAVIVIMTGGAALVPLGIAIGALLPNPREAVAMVSFPFMMIAGISGVLTPNQGLPNWLNYIADIFPLAWMTRGTRDAFAGHLHTFPAWIFVLVCAVWLAAGSLLAVPLMRTMVRKQTGASLIRRKDKATVA
ncbi:ABC transporter permease [Streptomyces sp. NBC_00078]|uniref:ABC transporter permease n=1 Tax=unclassified Streptomyces TaxID=2593676 RepID=UPI0022513D18|nr:ABC transporter permease [Streptomyces sp. NBC_00078]MCX5421896.1 ABC transporter permease [Streptomyces sp. NBC_00078]